MTYKATVGTISHGTLRAADLLESFADELARLEPGNDLVDEARAVITLDRAGWSNLVDSEEASDLLTSLVDALNEHAPAYCYFGTTDGDGSDFGFWPSMEAIEELPQIQNVDGEELPDEDHAYVNDHGNVTVYAADGTVILELV
jgi:hypothetical protein